MNQATSQLICQSLFTPQLICQSLFMSPLICQRSLHVSADRPESRHSWSSRVSSLLVCSSRVLSLPVCCTQIVEGSSSVSQTGIQRGGPTAGVSTCRPSCSWTDSPVCSSSHNGDRFMVYLGCIHHHWTFGNGGVLCDVSRGGGWCCKLNLNKDILKNE